MCYQKSGLKVYSEEEMGPEFPFHGGRVVDFHPKQPGLTFLHHTTHTPYLIELRIFFAGFEVSKSGSGWWRNMGLHFEDETDMMVLKQLNTFRSNSFKISLFSLSRSLSFSDCLGLGKYYAVVPLRLRERDREGVEFWLGSRDLLPSPTNAE